MEVAWYGTFLAHVQLVRTQDFIWRALFLPPQGGNVHLTNSLSVNHHNS